ncbi:hypothetical protein JW710_03480 [Candidatus Dojkabacteria bacterium]|nr:hypothetical protein [Candidatus Dojkabacteria bacterium]
MKILWGVLKAPFEILGVLFQGLAGAFKEGEWGGFLILFIIVILIAASVGSCIISIIDFTGL